MDFCIVECDTGGSVHSYPDVAAASEGKEGKSDKAKAAGPVRRHVVKTAGVLFTFVYFSLTCVFFRSETVGQALEIFRHLFTGGIALPAEAMMQSFNLDEFWYVIKLLHLDSLPYSQMYLGGIITAVTMAVVFLHRMRMKWR